MSAVILVAYVAWSLVAFSLCGRPIREAKTREGWSHASFPDKDSHAPEAAGQATRDDDAQWIAGQFYRNPEDPRLWVPKRAGIGLTVNLSHPGRKLFVGVTLLGLLVTLAVSLFA